MLGDVHSRVPECGGTSLGRIAHSRARDTILSTRARRALRSPGNDSEETDVAAPVTSTAQARAYVWTLCLAALLGVPVAFASVLYETALHDVIHVVWEDLPDAFGWTEVAWWYVILVPGLAGLLVAVVARLPGHGGHSPLEGLGVDPVRPIDLPSILLATLASLGLGLVLGPEAPLLALGLGLGAMVVRLV